MSSAASTASASDVAADERVEGVSQHLLRSHSGDVNQHDGRMLQVALAGFADVDGQVADALEVGVDLDGCDDHHRSAAIG